VVGIGNELNGDDAAGVLVVRGLRHQLANQPHLLLIEAGLAPENFTGPLRRFQPDMVVLVDAAEMGEPAGSVAWVDWEEIGGLSASTHTLPPTMLASFLMSETGCRVGLIGIQPEHLEMEKPISSVVKSATKQVARVLATTLKNQPEN
jgi:hydrogenase 3 maturation protease